MPATTNRETIDIAQGLRYAALASTAFAALAVYAGTAEAAPGRTTTDLSMRSGPSTNYERLTVIPAGASVDIGRCTRGYSWCEVDYRGYEGWSSGRYLRLERPDVRGPIADVEIDLPLPITDIFEQIGIDLGGGDDRDRGRDRDGRDRDRDDRDGRDGRDGRDRGGDDVARGEVCFYADFDYGGDRFCARRGDSDGDLSSDWNDRISSVRTGAGARLLVCEHYDYEGRCRRIGGNVESFSGEWNDVISSYEVEGAGRGDRDGRDGRDRDGRDRDGRDGRDGDRGDRTENRTCFYEDYDFGGASFCTDPGDRTAEIRGEWNDRISAIRVGRGERVRICQDYNFDGACRIVSNDVSALQGNWNDAVSSYAVRERRGGRGGRGRDDRSRDGRGERGAICFYEDYDFGGESFCAGRGDRQAEIGSEWNDRISSIRIRGGAELQVCEDYGFDGNCRIIRDNVSALRGDWNDTISSFRSR